MDSPLENRVVLVTGANRGIGKAICAAFAAEGAQVIVACRDLAAGKAVAAGLGRRSRAELLDLASQRSIEALGARVAQDPGRLDILVNNAGVLLDKDASPAQIARESLEATLQINLHGTIQLTQALLPLLKRSDWGRIINVSSGMGSLADGPSSPAEAYAPSYRISKAALNAYTVGLAAALKDTEILVNSMCPGWVKTDMGGPEAPRTPEEAARGAVMLAVLESGGPTGKFFRDGVEIPF